MARQKEWTLAEISVELGVPLEQVITARSMLAVWPLRRDAAGMAFYDRKALSLFHRLLIERDPTAVLERGDPEALIRYLNAQIPDVEFKLREPTAEERKFDELLAAGDIEGAEKFLDEAWPI